MRFYARHTSALAKNVANAGTGSVSNFVVETAGAHTFSDFDRAEGTKQAEELAGKGEKKRPKLLISFGRFLVPPIGIEPMTRDFQSPALPTELQRQMATRIRLELTTSSVTG